LADFTDGTSNTVAVAERLISSAATTQQLWSGPDSLRSYCGGTGSARSLPQWIHYCGTVSVCDPTYSLPIGRSWISGWTLVGNTHMHALTLNGRHCHIYDGEDDGNNLVTPGSRHPGGVNVVLVDGSVRSINTEIAMLVWWAVGSRNGGEIAQLEP
jgi:prepilin-type processing-associated H-X9-DG protein